MIMNKERLLSKKTILFELDRELVSSYTESEVCQLVHEIYCRQDPVEVFCYESY